LATALFGEGRDRWSLVREKPTHEVNVDSLPCKIGFPTEHGGSSWEYQKKNQMNSESTAPPPPPPPVPWWRTTTVLERSFYQPLDPNSSSSKPLSEIWLHEDCGNRQSAEHDFGRYVIQEHSIPGGIGELLKVRIEISEEGFLLRRPSLDIKSFYPEGFLPFPLEEEAVGRSLTLTWEGANLTLSKERLAEVGAQLVQEITAQHAALSLKCGCYK
jgi:hypothetical protein